jgi:hypothetical protein
MRMPIQVVPYTPEWVDGVLAFNARMRAGGTDWGWYASPVDEWLPEREGRKTWREHWLAVEDGACVRGAYGLKPHEWRILGAAQLVTDWQGPVTEGLISRRYNTLGLRLLREMLKQHPLLYSWGHGGLEQPMLLMLDRLGWRLHRTPFLLRVLRPVPFLRRNGYLRTSPGRRLLLDAAAFSGAGWLGLNALHRVAGLRARRSAPAVAEPFDRFEAWADELWQRCAGRYAALAVRDAATMNALLAPGRWPPALKLRVVRGAATLGWAAVMDTAMRDDERFGTLRVGSLVDGLADPADAEAVVGAAFHFLRARGVDLVVSNQSHPAWIAGFVAHGFIAVPDRRVFAASPELAKRLEPWAEVRQGLHLTNLDGHGPLTL